MEIPAGMTIDLANGTPREAAARDLLVNLLQTYDLSRWRYTNHIRISENEIPHSHPVLTLSGNHTPDHPLRMVTSYIHEQLHWFWLLAEHGDRLDGVHAVFERTFPNLPVGPPLGCRSVFSNYLHIAINYWELEGMASLIGMEEARAFIARMPFYTAIYQLVLAETERIGAVLAEHDLVVPPQPPPDLRFLHTID